MRKFFLFLCLACFFTRNHSFAKEGDDFCLITIAKSGSHLTEKCLENLTGKKGRFVLTHVQVNRLKNAKTLFFWAHFHQEGIAKCLLELPNTKCIFNVRDLRDVAISRVNQWVREGFIPFPDRVKSKRWLSIPYNEKLSSLFQPSVWGMSNYAKNTLSFRKFMHHFNNPNVYVTSFEKLVGPSGGGSEELQIQEITNLAKFLNIPLSKARAQEIAKNLFGDTKTFRKGQTKVWESVLNQENVDLFKKHFGDLLIFLGYEKDLNWNIPKSK